MFGQAGAPLTRPTQNLNGFVDTARNAVQQVTGKAADAVKTATTKFEQYKGGTAGTIPDYTQTVGWNTGTERIERKETLVQTQTEQEQANGFMQKGFANPLPGIVSLGTWITVTILTHKSRVKRNKDGWFVPVLLGWLAGGVAGTLTGTTIYFVKK